MRYELTDKEWTAINPKLPNKPRGVPVIEDAPDPGTIWIPFYAHPDPEPPGGP